MEAMEETPLGSNGEEVILIKFVDSETPKQLYGSTITSSSNGNVVMASLQQQQHDSYSGQEKSEMQLNGSIERVAYGTMLSSFNFIVLTSVVLYFMYILFPKSLRRYIAQKRNKHYKSPSTMEERESIKRTYIYSAVPEKDKKFNKGRNRSSNNMSWQQRRQCDTLFPIREKSIVDDALSLQTIDDDEELSNIDHSLRFRKEYVDLKENNDESSSDRKKVSKNRDSNSSETKLTLSDKNYGSSLPALNTSFVSTCSMENASSNDNEELSPTECFQHDKSFESIFRQKTGRSRTRKPSTKIAEAKKTNKEKNSSKQQKCSSKQQQIPLPTPQPPNSRITQPAMTPTSSIITNDVFSVDTNLFSPQANHSVAAPNNKISKRVNNNSSNSNKIVLRENNTTVNQLADSNGSKLDTATVEYSMKTPNSINSLQSKGNSSIKMDFTPSPLSIFSYGKQGFNAIVILISSEIIYPEQHVQQQNALMILLSDKFHLPVKVVDGNQEKDKKRREELFRLSGIRGQYPQIFLIHDSGKTQYFGNYVVLEKLVDSIGGIQNCFSPSLLKMNSGHAVDTSFFSI